MYRVKIISSFSAAHFLRGYQGKCESLHGHNWKVEVLVSKDKLGRSGMVIDFSELKRITAKVVEELDHCNLNDRECFKADNPSSENIARYIFNGLKEETGKRGCRLERVIVWEAENSCASYAE